MFTNIEGARHAFKKMLRLANGALNVFESELGGAGGKTKTILLYSLWMQQN